MNTHERSRDHRSTTDGHSPKASGGGLRASQRKANTRGGAGIALLQQYPLRGADQQLLALHLAGGDLTSARAQVDAGLLQHNNAWWMVQDLHLELLEAGLTTDDISQAQRAQLEAYATSLEAGAANAQAWLAGLGVPYTTEVILPSDFRSPSLGNHTAVTHAQQQLLQVHPNPTNADAYVAYKLPEGAESAWLEVVDNTGRSVLSKGMNGDSGVAEIPKSLLTPGLYHVVLRADGIRVAQVKLTAVR